MQHAEYYMQGLSEEHKLFLLRRGSDMQDVQWCRVSGQLPRFSS
jgi:hypothetical protein